MKFFLPVVLFLTIVTSIFYTGCSPTSSDGGSAILRGIVLDTSMPGQPKINSVTVLLQPVNMTTTTNDSGMFIFTNLAAGTYTLTLTKTGYYNKNITVEIIADDTTKVVTIPFLSKKIYYVRDRILDVTVAGKFLDGSVVANTSADKDAQTIDTLVGTDNLIFLGSADIMTPAGFQTWFSNRNYIGCTQEQFDTLSAYYTEDGLQRPEDRDFPNHLGLDNLIDVNNYQNAVWFFYLRGRKNAGLTPTVFGAMYLDSAWYDAGLDRRRIRVDIKINADGKYNFNPNLVK